MKLVKQTYSEISYLQSRSRSHFITATISIALVLFFLGLFCTLALFGGTFIGYAKESMQMKVFLHDGISQKQINQLLAEVKMQPYTAKAIFISKEDAGKILLEKTGEDVKKLMGGINPLLASVNVKLKSKYIDSDSFPKIQAKLMKNQMVSEVVYPVNMLTAINKNVLRLSFLTLLVGIIVGIIAFYLIVNTIRLSIYSQRLDIRTMQLIGATEQFIRTPFLRKGMIQGVLGGGLAMVFLSILVTIVNIRLASMDLGLDFLLRWEYLVITLGIILFGGILGYWGSYMAVNKYLNRSLDELF